MFGGISSNCGRLSVGGKANELVRPAMALKIIMTPTLLRVEKEAINHTKPIVSFYIML